MQTTPTSLADKDAAVAAILKKWVCFSCLIMWMAMLFWGIYPLAEQVMLYPIFRSEIKQGQYVFDIPTVAHSIVVAPSDILNHLQNLKVGIIKRDQFLLILIHSLCVCVSGNHTSFECKTSKYKSKVTLNFYCLPINDIIARNHRCSG